MEPASRRLKLNPSRFSSWKVPDCHPRTGFCAGTTLQSTQAPQYGSLNGGDDEQGDLEASLFTKYRHSWLFSLLKSEVEAGWPLSVAGQLQDELIEGHWNYLQTKTSSPLPFGNRMPWKVCPTQLWLGLKESLNNWVFSQNYLYKNLFCPAQLIWSYLIQLKKWLINF